MSDLQQPDDYAGNDEAMNLPPIGLTLRAAREARGESIAEVASALKLSSRQVVAMEAEQFHELPGPAFVRGFFRNYGRYLGVDIEPLIAAHWTDGATRDVNLTPVTNAYGTMPASSARGNVGRASAVIVLGLVAALALGWYFDGFRLGDDRAGPDEPISESAQENASDVQDDPVHVGPDERELLDDERVLENAPRLGDSPAIDDLRAGEGIPVAAQPPVALADAPAVARSAPVVDATPRPDAAEAPATESVEEPTVVAVDVQPATGAAASPPSGSIPPNVTAPGASRIVFRLNGDAWLQVRDAADKTLYSGTSAAGSTRVVQGDPPFWVTVGNADAVKLEYNGQSVDLAPHMHTAGVARLVLE